jgi:hypothetical protein
VAGGSHVRYDPLGRRTSKQLLNRAGRVVDEVVFSWDGALLAEESHSGRSTTWEWRPDALVPLAQIERDQADNDERFFAIVADLAGAPVELVDSSGALAWQADGELVGRRDDIWYGH